MVLIGNNPSHASDSEPQNTSRFAGTNLTGWAGIENYVMKHDAATMKDYAEDIDTLLVFAALFSAILTTFVVETYQSLQPDSNGTTNQLLAYQISSQGNHTNMPPAIHTTISTLLTASSFTPPASARWINGLFFSSLVISLVAALFGIMAKQWIREYLKWNLPLADPRENVLVRQIRFECWEAWHVDTFIWSIPVLQELAMVLFLIGVVVLVWTLDSAVAVFITILITFFLTVILVVTVLPILVKRCPYKSPTAWAFIRLLDIVNSTAFWIRYNIFGGRTYRYRFKFGSFLRARTWRLDDMLSNWSAQIPAAHEPAKLQLARIATHLGENGTFISEPYVKPDSVFPSSCLNHFIDSLSEAPTLIRALEWVSRTSHRDTQINTCINQCMSSVHTGYLPTTPHLCRGVALLHLYLFSPFRSSTSQRPQSHISLDDVAASGHDSNSLDRITLDRQLLKVVARSTSNNAQQLTFVLHSEYCINSCPSTFDQEGVQIRLLAADLQRLLEGSRSKWIHNDCMLRTVFEWVSMLISYGQHRGSWAEKLLAEQHLGGLRSILNDEPEHKIVLGSRATGLRTLTFVLACQQAKVSVNRDKTLSISPGPTQLVEYEALLFDYLDRDFERCSEENLNIFVFVGWQWLVRVDVDSDSSSTYDRNINAVKMIQTALEVASVRNICIRPHQFVSYGELIQFAQTMAHTQPGTSWFSPSYISVFAEFLHVIEIYYRRRGGLIQIDQDIFHAMLIEAHPNDHCKERACPWTSHSCNYALHCPLLELDRIQCQRWFPTPAARRQEERQEALDTSATADRSLLDQGKSLLRRGLRLGKPADEERGHSSAGTGGSATPESASFSCTTSTNVVSSSDTAGIDPIPREVFVGRLVSRTLLEDAENAENMDMLRKGCDIPLHRIDSPQSDATLINDGIPMTSLYNPDLVVDAGYSALLPEEPSRNEAVDTPPTNIDIEHSRGDHPISSVTTVTACEAETVKGALVAGATRELCASNGTEGMLQCSSNCGLSANAAASGVSTHQHVLSIDAGPVAAPYDVASDENGAYSDDGTGGMVCTSVSYG